MGRQRTSGDVKAQRWSEAWVIKERWAQRHILLRRRDRGAFSGVGRGQADWSACRPCDWPACLHSMRVDANATLPLCGAQDRVSRMFVHVCAVGAREVIGNMSCIKQDLRGQSNLGGERKASPCANIIGQDRRIQDDSRVRTDGTGDLTTRAPWILGQTECLLPTEAITWAASSEPRRAAPCISCGCSRRVRATAAHAVLMAPSRTFWRKTTSAILCSRGSRRKVSKW